MKTFLMKLCMIIQWITVGIGLLCFVLPLMFWENIPERIPTHYNVSGVADAWGGKEIIILLIFLAVILLGMMCIAAYVVKTNVVSKYTNVDERVGQFYAYALIVWLNFVLELFFAYVIYACATAKAHLGTWIIYMLLVLVLGPIMVLIFMRNREQKKTEKGLQLEQEKRMQGQVWRSRVDLWLVILLLGSLGWMLYEVITGWINGGKANATLLITFLIMAVIILPLFFIKYVFYEDYFKIDCSLYGVERVSYDSIVSIKKTMNPLSSAALSLRRLEIHYKINGTSKMVLISPKNRNAFIEEIEKRKNQRVE